MQKSLIEIAIEKENLQNSLKYLISYFVQYMLLKNMPVSLEVIDDVERILEKLSYSERVNYFHKFLTDTINAFENGNPSIEMDNYLFFFQQIVSNKIVMQIEPQLWNWELMQIQLFYPSIFTSFYPSIINYKNNTIPMEYINNSFQSNLIYLETEHFLN